MLGGWHVSALWLQPSSITRTSVSCTHQQVDTYRHTCMDINNESTKAQNPRRNKCSAVVKKNCLVAEYRVPYRTVSGPRTIIGASLSEPHVVRLLEWRKFLLSVCLSVCLSVDVRLAKNICCFNPHTGFNFAFSRRQFGRFDAHNTWHSLYKDKSN